MAAGPAMRMPLIEAGVPGGRPRTMPRPGRRGGPGWLVLLSLTLHLAVLAALLVRPPQPVAPEAEPMSVELVADTAVATPEAAASAAAGLPEREAEARPADPVPDAVPDAVPIHQVPPPPPAEPVEASAPVPAPAPEPLPTEQAESPVPPHEAAQPARPRPSPPAPPAPPAQVPVPAARPLTRRPAPRPAPSRPPGTPGKPAEPSATLADGGNVPSRPGAAGNGAEWMGRLKQWWDQNSFYPREASQTNEGGSVRLRITIAGTGQVTAVSVVQGSGSPVLDAAAVAVFRGARLTSAPAGASPQPADVVITVHYRPGDTGR